LEINSSNNNSLIQNLVDKFRDAFNSHNAERLGSLLAEDGEWTDVIGHTMIGKEDASAHLSFYYSIKRSKT
jgi:uncharacterized protein (TIGR02246 family)